MRNDRGIPRSDITHISAFAGFGEGRCGCERGQVVVALEVAVDAETAGVDDALGNAFVVEVEDLLAQHEVLQQRRPTLAAGEAVLIIGNCDPLGRRHRADAVTGDLVGRRVVGRLTPFLSVGA